MFIGPAAFVVAEEKDRIAPRSAVHKGVEDLGHFRLSQQHRLPRARVLIVSSISGFDEREAGQRAIGQIGEELREWRESREMKP